MKTTINIIANIIILFFGLLTTPSNAQWSYLAMNFNGDTTFNPSAYLADMNTIYVLAGRRGGQLGEFRTNAVYKSINGGKNYVILSNNKLNLNSFDGITGLGRDTVIVSLPNNRIIRSYNGGASWDTVFWKSGSPSIIDGLLIINTDSNILTSSDLGDSWSYQGRSFVPGFYKFFKLNSAVAFDYKTRMFYRSLDTGRTWSQTGEWTSSIGSTNYNIGFVNENIFLFLINGQLYRSINSGLSWVLVDNFPKQSSTNMFNHGIYFINEKDGFILNGQLFKTNDSGKTWCKLDVGPFNLALTQVANLAPMYFLNDSVGLWFGSQTSQGVNGFITTNQGGPPCPSDTTIKGLGAEPGFNQLKVYPNPSSGLLTLTLEQGQMSLVQLFTVDGRLVFSQKLAEQEATLHLPSISPGIYILEVQTTENQVLRQKLVME